MMNKVKICGITNFEDALACAKLKVDLIGFIFYSKSPRYLELEKAKDICNQLENYEIKKVRPLPFQEEASEFDIGFSISRILSDK